MALTDSIEKAVRYWARIAEIPEDNMVAIFNATNEQGGYLYRNNVPMGGVTWSLIPYGDEAVADNSVLYKRYFSAVFTAFGMSEVEANAFIDAMANSRVDEDGEPGGANTLDAQIDSVPDLEPYNVDTYESILAQNSLVPGEITYSTGLSSGVGAILYQSPSAGGGANLLSPVDVEIHLGCAVPNVSYFDDSPTNESAQGVSTNTFLYGLFENFLLPGQVTLVEFNPDPWIDPITGTTWDVTNFSTGNVIYCNPEPGNLVDPGTTVDFTVLGVTVPSENVVGQLSGDAGDHLEGMGFTVDSIVRVSVDNVAADTVVGTYPAAGSVLIPGSTITIYATPE